jgi:hypothetical protein
VQQVEEESRKLQATLKTLQDEIEGEKHSQGKSSITLPNHFRFFSCMAVS